MILLLIDLLKYLKKFEWYRNIWNWKTHICCTRTWIVSLLLQLKITNWTKYQVATWIWLCTSLQKDSNTDFFFDFLYFVYTDATNCLQQDHMLYKMSLDVQKLDRRDPTLWEMNKALVTGLNPNNTGNASGISGASSWCGTYISGERGTRKCSHIGVCRKTRYRKL